MGVDRLSVNVVTANDSASPCTVAVLSNRVEIPDIRGITFRHYCDKIPTADIEVVCEEIEANADGVLTTWFMGKRYWLIEEET